MEEQKTIPQMRTEKGELSYWANMAMIAERMRVAAQVRETHLEKTHRTSPDNEKFLKLARASEEFVDGRLAYYIVDHPTWPWACRILGIGKENYPKVIGPIHSFGRYYDVGDPMIPAFVHRPVQEYEIIVEGEVVSKSGIWVEGIERLANPSKLWKYVGWDVDPLTGEARKRRAGQKISFNADLRMAFYRLGTSLMKAKSIWYLGKAEDGYSPGYERYRERIVERKGVTVISTPKARFCSSCQKEVTAKKTLYCPDCGDKLSLKKEGPGYLFKGHLHQMAMREMLKDFSVCMWLVWREALGLPVTQPYKVAKLDHKPIDPWKMVDR